MRKWLHNLRRNPSKSALRAKIPEVAHATIAVKNNVQDEGGRCPHCNNTWCNDIEEQMI
jgi:hypothetical protein